MDVVVIIRGDKPSPHNDIIATSSFWARNRVETKSWAIDITGKFE